MTKDELKDIAKQFFPKNKVMYGTEDGHFFYKEIDAIRLVKGTEKEYFQFTAEDFAKPKKVESKPKGRPKAEPKKQG